MSISLSVNPQSGIAGDFFAPGSSRKTACRFHVNPSGYLICQSLDGEMLKRDAFAMVDVGSRLGNTPRYLKFSDGSKLESRDNDAIDELQSHWSEITGKKSGNWIHRLESRWRWIVVSVVCVAVIVFGTFRYGVPAVANTVAAMVPQRLAETAGDQTLAFLDRAYLAESRLSADEQKAVLSELKPLLDEFPDSHSEILFRDGGDIGANALALPNGQIILTDQLVSLAQTPDELLAVVAHEIGHVHHRHGIEMAVQGSLLTIVMVSVLGDPSAFSEALLSLPLVLTQSSYSRDLEREADQFALKALGQLHISPEAFANILLKLQGSHDGVAEDSGSTLQDYFSSHPATTERIETITSQD